MNRRKWGQKGIGLWTTLGAGRGREFWVKMIIVRGGIVVTWLGLSETEKEGMEWKGKQKRRIQKEIKSNA